MIKYNGDGSRKEKAINLLAKNEQEGVDTEYNWLEEKFGEQNINWELITKNYLMKVTNNMIN